MRARIFAKLGAMIAAALGDQRADLAAIREKTKIGPRALLSYFRHARRGGSSHGRFTRALRAKFAKNALARYGLDEKLPSGDFNPELRRVMRNARKRERQIARAA